MGKTPVTIITVNYNAAAKTVRMIESVREPDCDTVIEVLDNASAEHDVALLREETAGRSEVNLHFSKRNLGFARANNYLLRRSIREEGYTVIANNDVVMTEGAISRIISEMQKREVQVGTSTVCYLDQPDIIWYGGGTNRIDPRLKPRHENKGSAVSTVTGGPIRTVDFASGAWMIVHNKVFRRTFLFDKNLFFGEEDSEFCHRLIKLGIHILYVPNVVIYHEVGVSANSRANTTIHLFHISSKSYAVAKQYNLVIAMLYILAFTVFQLITCRKEISRRRIVGDIFSASVKGIANRGKDHAILS